MNLAPYLGKPWRWGCSGPDAFDCWGLLWAVYRDFVGVDVSLFPQVARGDWGDIVRALEGWEGRSDWRPINAPEHLCAVGMSRNSRIHHVGVFLDLDGGLILHAAEGKNVVVESLAKLRTTGFSTLKFFKYVHGLDV